MRNMLKPPVEFSSQFNAQRKAAPLEIKVAFREVLEIFLVDPQNDALGNHSLDTLGKKFFGVWSIDVTGDWRALYRIKGNKIIFTSLGTHDQFYG